MKYPIFVGNKNERMMETDELRDKVFELAPRLKEDEVIAVERDGLKLLVSGEGVLVRMSDGWVSLQSVIVGAL